MSELLNCFSHVNKRRLLNCFMNGCYLTVTDCEKIFGIDRRLAHAHLSELTKSELIERYSLDRKNVLYYIDPNDPRSKRYIKKVFVLLKIQDEAFIKDLENYKHHFNELRSTKIYAEKISPTFDEVRKILRSKRNIDKRKQFIKRGALKQILSTPREEMFN